MSEDRKYLDLKRSNNKSEQMSHPAAQVVRDFQAGDGRSVKPSGDFAL
jgi:hypothetical protein